jgi:AhpD family alkylhydroperoxidase
MSWLPSSMDPEPETSQFCAVNKDTQKRNSMKKFRVPTRDQVSSGSQTSFDTLQKALGMVPNLYATMAYSENGLNKYLAFQAARTSLSSREKEAVNLVVSQVNGCIYCQSAHTILGKMNGFSGEEILKIRSGHSSHSKLDALVVLAKDIVHSKGHISEKNLETFYAVGYDNGNLVDLILQIGDKIMMNYLHNLTDIPVDFPLAEPLDTVLVQ